VTVAAVYDRRFSLQRAIKPAVIDRRYSGTIVPRIRRRTSDSNVKAGAVDFGDLSF